MLRLFILKLWKNGSGSMKHYFHTWIHTWIGHNNVLTSSLWRIFGMCWKTLCAVVQILHKSKFLAKRKRKCNSGQKFMLYHCMGWFKQWDGENTLQSELKVIEHNVSFVVEFIHFWGPASIYPPSGSHLLVNFQKAILIPIYPVCYASICIYICVFCCMHYLTIKICLCDRREDCFS